MNEENRVGKGGEFEKQTRQVPHCTSTQKAWYFCQAENLINVHLNL